MYGTNLSDKVVKRPRENSEKNLFTLSTEKAALQAEKQLAASPSPWLKRVCEYSSCCFW